jgi:hypothetical protein
MQVRTALEHLKLTGEITVKAYPKYSVITVKNYDYYQTVNSQNNSQITLNQQSTNSQITVNQQSINSNGRKNKKDNKDNKEKEYPPKSPQGGRVRDSDSFFEKFWAEYPKHAKKDWARREFEKYMNDERLKDYSREERVSFLVQAVRAWKSSEQWQAENGRYIPNAANWLKDEKYTQKYLRELKATQTEVWSGYPELGADLKHD